MKKPRSKPAAKPAAKPTVKPTSKPAVNPAIKPATTTRVKPVTLAEKLTLYLGCVQNPESEVRLLTKIHQAVDADYPTLLREDFAGTCAVACEWVNSDPDRQAMAVDKHEPTLKWAWARAEKVLADRADDLHLACSDVLETQGPKVDVISGSNFCIYEIHERPQLIRYLKKCKARLRDRGVAAFDGYTGPGALTTGEQSRELTTPIPLSGRADAVRYVWEQRAVDLATHRVENHIHVELADGTRLKSLFVYHWRLWSAAELIDAMTEAGFDQPAVWSDTENSQGQYEEVKSLPTRKDGVIYVLGRRLGKKSTSKPG